ncbi:hypothetical protein [Streptomyces sp. BA2]|uniref:hypothetical protein n=1 Tax=Streptomyces sp. BA2 TaxID=436595 RepID=UPI001F1DBC14|nr:hypothetical protein [Streptomyces sp. BA2]
MRIRTALAVTALAATAVLGASGTALADDDHDRGWRAGFAYENLGGPAGITKAAGHGEGGHHDRGWHRGFAYENLGGPAGITHAAGYGAGSHDEHDNDDD